MTDVPFAFWTTASLAALCAGLRRRGAAALAWLGAGLVLAAAATALRQPGAAIGIGLVVALVATRVRTWRQAAGLALAAALAAGAMLAVSALLFGSGDGGGTMLRYLVRRVLASPSLPYFLVCNALVVLAYAGAFLSPIAPLVAPPRHARALGAAAALAMPAVPLATHALGLAMPPGVNLIWNTGLGAPTLAGFEQLPRAPEAVWWVLVGLGAASGTWTLGSAALAVRPRALRDQPELWLLGSFAAVYLVALGLRFPFFDRYVAVALAPLGGLALALAPRSSPGRGARAASAAAFALLALYALLGTRDYMERHRARDALLAGLDADGIASQRIDGGFEHAGWNHFDRDESGFLDNPRRWVFDDEFLVTYAASRPGYVLLRELEYARWLPPGREHVRVLVRESGPATRAAAAARRSPDEGERR